MARLRGQRVAESGESAGPVHRPCRGDCPRATVGWGACLLLNPNPGRGGAGRLSLAVAWRDPLHEQQGEEHHGRRVREELRLRRQVLPMQRGARLR